MLKEYVARDSSGTLGLNDFVFGEARFPAPVGIKLSRALVFLSQPVAIPALQSIEKENFRCSHYTVYSQQSSRRHLSRVQKMRQGQVGRHSRRQQQSTRSGALPQRR